MREKENLWLGICFLCSSAGTSTWKWLRNCPLTPGFPARLSPTQIMSSNIHTGWRYVCACALVYTFRISFPFNWLTVGGYSAFSVSVQHSQHFPIGFENRLKRASHTDCWLKAPHTHAHSKLSNYMIHTIHWLPSLLIFQINCKLWVLMICRWLPNDDEHCTFFTKII